ncbi:MAG: isoprenyl transferase [Lachnospiraceae bacterium]|nr:isoprenyl transferase [Lachnospiraceae bacterium]MBR4542675.1 isoprenyl transferase [Lachnospiraceae bacterium]
MTDRNQEKIPKHIAVILDGNGRWAKAKGLPRKLGHVQGAKTIEEVCELMWNHGVEYFTVYAFSTENWKRSEEEVSALMTILREYMVKSIQRANANNMRVRIIGEKSRLAEDIQKSIADLEKATVENTGLKFTIAINYGSRDEITRAVRRIVSKAENGEISADSITEDMISAELDTAGYPDPDLLIRTSGEQRISNFLLWQCAYSEFYFTDVLWPDFGEKDLAAALDAYAGRERRYGGRQETTS